jgi:hypothetical protein
MALHARKRREQTSSLKEHGPSCKKEKRPNQFLSPNHTAVAPGVAMVEETQGNLNQNLPIKVEDEINSACTKQILPNEAVARSCQQKRKDTWRNG